MQKKNKYLIALCSALFLIAIFAVFCHLIKKDSKEDQSITVGFVYVGDESTPYTSNFIQAQEALENQLTDKVTVLVKTNVPEGAEEEPLRELAEAGCNIIFTTSYGYGENAKKIAREYPDIQICQATGNNANSDPVYPNYHTFMGEIYQGRYISGIVAGMKLAELIQQGDLTTEEAVIGYVAAFPYAEVISGYTAFLLGVRAVVPQAVMKVRYVNTWSSYSLEKQCAEKLIAEGCKIISQHSDTTGPAVACEESDSLLHVYHIGYNQSMIDVAPTTSLISSRINWTPYITGAVEAVLDSRKIEDCVSGNVNGNDIGAGFDYQWVDMLQLNRLIAAEGTQNRIDESISDFENNECQVYIGDYMGVNPEDETDTYDLSQGFTENANSSAPMFHYVLKDVITIEQ